jgi:hypothetical protein
VKRLYLTLPNTSVYVFFKKRIYCNWCGSYFTVANSSSNVQGTEEELKTTGSVIMQSRKLLDKYGRREFTDKFLLLFAFAFFLACVLYIIQKRLF